MLQPGQVIDQRYEVVRKVGQGAMATVYEARHSGLHSRHALKVLDTELAQDPDLRNRFLAEGRIQAQLRHPNIIAVTDIVTDPVPGLVMELMDGLQLDEHLRAHGVPGEPAKVLQLFLPVLDAVGAAHAAGVVHRDLKPENILVGPGPKGGLLIKVADFGIAKVLEEADLSTGKAKTDTGIRMGTVLYMSPEQIRGSADLDARSDIFALGAILYEIATGRIAFDAPSEYDTMSNIVAGNYQAPERVVGGLHPGLGACIRKALAVDPAERFPDCATFRHTLELSITGGGPLPAPPTRSVAVTSARPVGSQPPGPATVTPPPQAQYPVPQGGQPGSPAAQPGQQRMASYPPQQMRQRTPQQMRQQRYVAQRKDPSVAAILEALPGFFLHIFGIGHMYNGNVGKGLALMFGYWGIQFINLLLCLVLIGYLTGFVTWVLFIALSASSASKDARFINAYS